MRCFALAALLCLPAALPAEVVDSESSGFTVHITTTIHAAPDEVYRRFVQNVGDWWNPSHTFSGNSHNLAIEAKPMGCFCERLPNGGSARHMEVITVIPGQSLILSGALGPMQSLAVAGTMSIQVRKTPEGAELDVTYSVAGYSGRGINIFAKPSDAMLSEQFMRFRNFIERGDPAKNG